MFNNHKFAFGRLKWKPEYYYTASPYEFVCAVEGYWDEMEDKARIARTLASITAASMGVKEDITKYWRLFGDPQPEIMKPFTPDEVKALEEKFNRVNAAAQARRAKG